MTYENPTFLDVVGEYVFGFFARPYYRSAIERSGLRPGEDVLEFGSGGGACSRVLATSLRGEGTLTCLDINKYWLDKVAGRLRGRDNVHFVHQDVARAPLPKNIFDLVFIHFVLHDISASVRKPVIDALAKTLRPDGRIFIREPTKDDHGMPVEEVRSLMDAAGLRETYAKEDKKLVLGPFFEALYVAKE
jgi:ubiquinone/menaquinone biosynthesis C-methylase UbiE